MQNFLHLIFVNSVLQFFRDEKHREHIRNVNSTVKHTEIFNHCFQLGKYEIINLDVLTMAFGTFFVDTIMSAHIKSEMEDE